MCQPLRKTVSFLISLVIASVITPTDAIAASAAKDELTSHQVAVKFFDKQAKLKAVKSTDEDYSMHLQPKKDEKKGLWGYVNDKDKWEIKPVFDEVEEFSEDGFAMVCFAGFWGMIDKSRSFTIVPINHKIQRSSVSGLFISECPSILWNEFSSQSYSKKRDDVLNQATATDQISKVIWAKEGTPFKDIAFNTVQDFDDNQNAIVSTTMGYGLLNSNSNFVVEPKYHSLSIYSNELYRVDDNGNYGLVDQTGEIVLPPKYDIIEEWSQDELIWTRSSIDQKWNAYDDHGTAVVEAKLDARPVWDNMSQAVVKSNDKYGILDKKGVFKVPCSDKYIEKTGNNEYWTIKTGDNVGLYRFERSNLQFIAMPKIKTSKSSSNLIIKEYIGRYSKDINERLWLGNLRESTFYSPYYEEESSAFSFKILGHNYEVQPVWEDTVRFVLKSLDFSKNYRLSFDKKVGCFDIDYRGKRGELFTNEYVIGTYDYDSDGVDELIIAVRDNSTPGWNKPSGGYYVVYKFSAEGQYSFVKSELISDTPFRDASFAGRTLQVSHLNNRSILRYPHVENFGLKGPVMTNGDLSFDINGQLTKIGGYIILYNKENIPTLPDQKVGDYSSTANHRIAQFDQQGISIEFDTDCMGTGKFEYAGSESWTFNGQGLLETFNPFACNGGCQMYYVYNPQGFPLYEIEDCAAWSVTKFLPETAVYDQFGNWISMKCLVYTDDNVYETTKTRTIEYYTESESGK